MKQLIILLTIIISLIVFFAEAETRAAVETKPIVDTQPVTETKLKTDAKPAAVPVVTEEEAIRANEDALKLLPKKETITQGNDIKSIAETITENKLVPMAIPVLTPEEAINANKDAIRFRRNKAMAKAFLSFIHTIGLNNNRIHFILSLLPLLFIIDVLTIQKEKKRSSKNHGLLKI